MLWDLCFRDLRRWVPQELVNQLRIRLWSALVVFSLNISENIMKFYLYNAFGYLSKIE